MLCLQVEPVIQRIQYICLLISHSIYSHFAFNFILMLLLLLLRAVFFFFLEYLDCDVCMCYILTLLFNSQLLVGYIDQFIDRNICNRNHMADLHLTKHTTHNLAFIECKHQTNRQQYTKKKQQQQKQQITVSKKGTKEKNDVEYETRVEIYGTHVMLAAII